MTFLNKGFFFGILVSNLHYVLCRMDVFLAIAIKTHLYFYFKVPKQVFTLLSITVHFAKYYCSFLLHAHVFVKEIKIFNTS